MNGRSEFFLPEDTFLQRKRPPSGSPFQPEMISFCFTHRFTTQVPEERAWSELDQYLPLYFRAALVAGHARNRGVYLLPCDIPARAKQCKTQTRRKYPRTVKSKQPPQMRRLFFLLRTLPQRHSRNSGGLSLRSAQIVRQKTSFKKIPLRDRSDRSRRGSSISVFRIERIEAA